MGDILSDFFDDNEFGDTTNLVGDDILSILESLDDVDEFPATNQGFNNGGTSAQKPSSANALMYLSETEFENSPKPKRLKTTKEEANHPDGQQRISHITVERNRRKQMNDHLSVLRSLMPCFYVKRGDQASIIGGVIDYINELQQVLQALEAKKQRKVYSEILSPRLVSPSPLSPRKPALSPRITLPISPRTPQPASPYKPMLQKPFLSPTMAGVNSVEPSPTSSSTSTSGAESFNELIANCKSSAAEVEVKFSAPNVLLKTVSPKIPGQAMKIISALENLSLEILQVNVNTVDETMVNSFTIKIGIECQLSAEDLAHRIQQTFC